MKGTATTMGFSPNEKYLAVGDSERHLRLYQVNSSSGGDNSPLVTLVHEWRSHAARVTCLAWNPNSTLLASGSLDCSIMIFKPDSDTRLVDCRSKLPIIPSRHPYFCCLHACAADLAASALRPIAT
ncbi:unnamed protein product, partial [Dibothriocephalus latus]